MIYNKENLNLLILRPGQSDDFIDVDLSDVYEVEIVADEKEEIAEIYIKSNNESLFYYLYTYESITEIGIMTTDGLFKVFDPVWFNEFEENNAYEYIVEHDNGTFTWSISKNFKLV